MLGITRAPGVQGALQFAAYTVSLLSSQTVPLPGGVVTFGSAVGEGMPQVEIEHPNK
jgi:hypothetical protein